MPLSSLLIGETVYQDVTIGKWIFKNVTVFPTLYYEYDCNTVCHKIFIRIHSLYKLSYCEAIVSVTLSLP